MPSRGALRGAAAASMAVLAGCASLAPPATAPISGRLSLQVAAHAGQPARGVNASFELRGTADAGQLRLSSLLGPQLAAARWAPGTAVLETGEGESRYANLDDLSRDALGEALPLRALPDWLAGRPWAGAPSAPLPPGAPGSPGSPGFEQLGWRLDLARWGEGFVTATRESPPLVILRLRLEQP